MHNLRSNEKRCTKCGLIKPKTEEFFGTRDKGRRFKSRCKLCERDYQREHYLKNRKRVLEVSRAYYHKNKERANAKQREWYQNNKKSRAKSIKLWQSRNIGEWRAIRREWERNSRKTNKQKVVCERISASIRRYLTSGRKGRSWRKYVDFTPEQLVEHLESLFLPGMSWENRNEWHIDHIKPITAFQFTEMGDKQFRECWSLKNLQPLWASDNIRKSNTYDEN